MALSPETFEGSDITQSIVQVDADPRVTRALRPLLISLMGSGGSYTYEIVAAGTNQSTATPLTSAVNHVSTTPAGTGVILSGALQQAQVFNDGANTLSVYPQVGAQIRSLGTNVAAGIAPNGYATFLQVSTGQWSVY